MPDNALMGRYPKGMDPSGCLTGVMRVKVPAWAEHWLGIWTIAFAAATLAVADPPPEPTTDPTLFDHFEAHVRPILIERCQSCHGPDEQSSSFRVDSREAILQGGELGLAIVPGEPEKSPLVESIRRHGKRPMPPDDPLPPDQVDAIVDWVKGGAPWPKRSAPASEKWRKHWAFQPLKRSPMPAVSNNDWSRSSVDPFILARLEAAGLAPAPEGDRRSLLRRLTMDLTGLLPTVDEISAFESASVPDAYERVVDQLLASPHYGEAWGRHWLDVARYADTKGYVYAREERVWTHAWAYRDWVVRTLNSDLPYDRFIMLQIAADQLAEDPSDLAAMGFLTLGRRFLGVTRDIIDDRIDVVTRGTMGLTAGCARCHDHKYDPISTKDYYSLYGVFDSCAEKAVRLPTEPSSAPGDEFEKGLAERERLLAEKMATRREEAAKRVRAKIKDYLLAQRELEKYPVEGFDVVIQPDDLVASSARRWRDYLDVAEARSDSVFIAWREFNRLEPDQFTARSAAVTEGLRSLPPEKFHPHVAAEFQSPPESIADVAVRYARVFEQVDQVWKKAREADPNVATLPNPDEEVLRKVLYGADAPCEPPDEAVVGNEFFFTTDICNELWKFQGDVDRWILSAPTGIACSLILVDRPLAKTPRVFRRGNPLSLGDKIPRKFLTFLESSDSKPFEQGSGRLELAQAIVRPDHPLTSRVMVNRVWLHHFGVGMVRTPSDFGLRAEPPSHPELLDELSLDLVEEGWSLKRLHRQLVTSAAYRQASIVPADSPSLERDADVRLVSRGRSHRLSFEEWRDASLSVTGDLQLAIGGRPEELFATAATTRRAIYGRVDRQFLPATLRIFDFANPDLHIPQRGETTVPQQALFFLNNPFVITRSRALADLDSNVAEPSSRVEAMYRRVFHRYPTNEETSTALAFIRAPQPPSDPVPAAASAWRYGFGHFDLPAGKLHDFHSLPFYTGKSWQGGADHPDGALGWVQLTATGGHTGNDHQHAAVRRFTAPRDVTVRVRSKIHHPVEVGDGVAAAIVVKGSIVAMAHVHHAEATLDYEPIPLKVGETIDFVVDMRENLNHEEFDWHVDIADTASSENWESKRDFYGQRNDALDPWTQLAQVLITSNEFLFID